MLAIGLQGRTYNALREVIVLFHLIKNHAVPCGCVLGGEGISTGEVVCR